MMRPPSPPWVKKWGGAGAPLPPRLQSLCVVMTGFFIVLTNFYGQFYLIIYAYDTTLHFLVVVTGLYSYT